MAKDEFSQILDWMFTGEPPPSVKKHQLLEGQRIFASHLMAVAGPILSGLLARRDLIAADDILDAQHRITLIEGALSIAEELVIGAGNRAAALLTPEKLEEIRVALNSDKS